MATTCHDESPMRMPEPESGPHAGRRADYESLRVERQGPVGWLVFDRPAAANAMNAEMMEELERAWRELDDDPDVRVIVNTGEGHAFQTGLDVAQLARDPDALREQSRRTKRFELRFTSWHNDVWKPVIAAVNGVCAGGGLHFVADADIVIVSSDATSSTRTSPWVRRACTRRSASRRSRRWNRCCGWRSSAVTSASRPRVRTSSASARRWSIRPNGSEPRPRRSAS